MKCLGFSHIYSFASSLGTSQKTAYRENLSQKNQKIAKTLFLSFFIEW